MKEDEDFKVHFSGPTPGSREWCEQYRAQRPDVDMEDGNDEQWHLD